MSSLLRAWYVFLGLALFTFAMTAFIGRIPLALSSSVAMPHEVLQRAGANLRGAAISLADRRNFRAEITRLEDEIGQLRAANRNLELNVNSLKQILRVREDQSPGVVTTASVTGVDSSAVFERLSLNKGSQQGVQVNMPVTVPEGLVGIVTDVTASSANVRAVTDPASRIGVTVPGRGGQGIAVGVPGERIRVTNFIEDEPVQVGDLVETSSRGGLFPRGILLGEVVQVFPRDPNELRTEFLVNPSVDMSTLLEVALIAPQ